MAESRGARPAVCGRKHPVTVMRRFYDVKGEQEIADRAQDGAFDPYWGALLVQWIRLDEWRKRIPFLSMDRGLGLGFLLQR
jgi:hypothetical protein